MTREIQVETLDSALHSLDVRKSATRTLLEALCDGDGTEVKIPPEQVLNLLLHNTLNQVTIMETLQRILMELRDENM